MRAALAAGEFRLHYQPIVRLASAETIGAEALIRWQRPDGALVPPSDFIPVAEQTGLIVPIGRWVLREASRQLRAWTRGSGTRVHVSVNLSARQFQDPLLVDTVREALAESEADPSLLRLEITESTVMSNPELAVRTLRALRELGVRISVDDFGTGYSSLGYLKRLPLDTLKIDRGFVRDLATDRDDLEISQAVIALGHGLGLEVVAEGVETPEQAEILLARGCDAAQGFLFGRPVEAGDFKFAGARAAAIRPRGKIGRIFGRLRKRASSRRLRSRR
jgi:EAL domain-containing protein (putative c-di-GMP-specific phosphodiesterase class I)